LLCRSRTSYSDQGVRPICVMLISSPTQITSEGRIPGDSGSSNGARFQNLLAELEREHLHEVAELSKEINLLRDKLRTRLDHSNSIPYDEKGCLVEEAAGVPPPGDSKVGPRMRLAPLPPPQDPDPEGEKDLPLEKSRTTLSTAGVQIAFDQLELRQNWKNLHVNDKWKGTLPPHKVPRKSALGGNQITSVVDKLKNFTGTSWMYPNTNTRMTWDVFGLVFITYDFVSVPMLMAFSPDSNTFTTVMEMITLSFWTLDMSQQFFIRYYSNGHLVTSTRQITWHYARTWFFLDALVVFPEWIVLLVGTGKKSEANKLFRAFRFVRTLRLLRVMKLQHLIHKFYDMIDNEYHFIFCELLKLVALILFFNHFIACFWYLIGDKTSSAGVDSWVTWQNAEYDQAHLGYKYATSLHWSLTQFTPASMDVVARNVYERSYSIVVLLFAMVGFSSIVGSVASSMTVLRQMKNDKQKSFWILRRYLKQQDISKELSLLMTKFLEHQVAKDDMRIQRANVKLLTKISEQLKMELAFEMNQNDLRLHALYDELATSMKGVALRLCFFAITAQSLAAEDVLFSAGEEAKHAVVLRKDHDICYFKPDYTLIQPPLMKGEWLTECTLWVSWRCRGWCKASVPSDVLVIDASKFGEVMSVHQVTWSFARRYGQDFVDHLNRIPEQDRLDVVREDELQKVSVRNSINSSDRNQYNLDSCGT